jgi:hypothetical protein
MPGTHKKLISNKTKTHTNTETHALGRNNKGGKKGVVVGGGWRRKKNKLAKVFLLLFDFVLF